MASYSDNFDRADGAIGANWTVDQGSFNIVSNVAEAATAASRNRARYVSALDTANHWVQATTGGKSTSNHGDVCARQASSTHTNYEAVYLENSSATGYKITKRVNGDETVLDTAASGSGAKTLKLTVNGATQTMLVNTVEVNYAEDTALTEGNYVGIFGYGNTGPRYNDWSAEDLAAGGPVIPVFMHHYKQQGVS